MMPRVTLRLLDCGSCSHAEAAVRAGASRRPVVFPSLVGLIRHPGEGIVLFDTGYDPAFFAATRRLPERLYRWATPVTLPPGASALERLQRLGLGAEAVQAVVLSHFHGDHVAGLARFPQARLHCARAGAEALQRHGRWGGTRRGLLKALVPAPMLAGARFFENAPRRALPAVFAPFTEGADLLGDGSLLAVPLPGHCPGHWGLALRLEDDRHALLIADAAWSIGAVADNAPPPRLTTALLGRTAPYRATLAQLHEVHRRTVRDDLLLLPSHCATAAASSGLLDADHGA